MRDPVATTTPRALAAVLSLDALAAHPELAAALPPAVRQALTLQALTVIGALAVAEPSGEPVARATAEDRAVGLKEAARMLDMTEDYLYRSWHKLGLGYKDADGHVKFPLSRVQRHIHRKAPR